MRNTLRKEQKELGRLIKKRRKALGWTIRDFMEAGDNGEAFIKGIENGDDIDIEDYIYTLWDLGGRLSIVWVEEPSKAKAKPR